MYFNIAEEIYNRHRDMFPDEAKVYFNRAARRHKVSYEEMVKKAKKSQSGVFSDEVRKKFGTVYTPEFVVDKTLDLAFKYLPEGSDPLALTWCDPAAGDGNFLINLYHRLMKCPSEMSPVEKSEHILTKCLYGVEILKNMWFSCRIRLFIAHGVTMKENGIKPKKAYCDIMERFNIFHGNTIMVPEDIGKWELGNGEGGLLSEEIRNKKYSVIIGNPPYTHLRNMDNRRYHAYPKQRDMAQVFVRWALDHVSENGVCSYNIIDTWLDVKTSDGALETRELIKGKIRESIQDDDIAKYSMHDGGALRTFIVCFSNLIKENFLHNERTINYDNFLKAGFLKRKQIVSLPFVSIGIKKYINKLNGGRSINKFGTNTEFWKSFIYLDDSGNEFVLAVKCRINVATENGGIRNDGNWKLIKTNDFKKLLNEKFEGEVKNAKVESKEIGLWLLGYSNSKMSLEQLPNYSNSKMSLEQLPNYSNDIGSVTSKTSTNYELSDSQFDMCQVPDFDYYKENCPEQFNTYMKWIEDNMGDKDKFLEGIDEQFERLIDEKNHEQRTTTNLL